MRVLFLVSDGAWSARARAFVLAARGLAARGHDVMLACEAECPVQVRAASSDVEVVALKPEASAAADTCSSVALCKKRASMSSSFIVTKSISSPARHSGLAVAPGP